MNTYVYAETFSDGLSFGQFAHLDDFTVVHSIETFEPMSCRFDEADEVYVLESAPRDLKAMVRMAHDKSWPRPHILKEVKRGTAKA